jgi:hypothetical protein
MTDYYTPVSEPQAYDDAIRQLDRMTRRAEQAEKEVSRLRTAFTHRETVVGWLTFSCFVMTVIVLLLCGVLLCR